MSNIDPAVVGAFGQQWARFDQPERESRDEQALFESYFSLFPWAQIGTDAQGFDLGCGTGRWAHFVARRVGLLHCIDASSPALEVARRNLSLHSNCIFHCASVDSIPLADGSLDFGYSLGVLHHIPDTALGIQECVRKLKPGAPFLIYLYYAFDNRPGWYRILWQSSDFVRRFVSRLPFAIRARLSDLIAAFVYWPLSRAAKVSQNLGADVTHFPLSAYRNRSFYSMRTDALDRFGTRLEKRFTRQQIWAMMKAAGLEKVLFTESPCWCAIGFRKQDSPSSFTAKA